MPGPTVRNTPGGLVRTRKRGRVLGTGRSHTVPATSSSPALRQQAHVARAAHAERVRTIQQPYEGYRSAQTRLRSLNSSLRDLYAQTSLNLTKATPYGTVTPSHSDILNDPRYKKLSEVYHHIALDPHNAKAYIDNAAERGLIDEKPHDFIARVGDLLPEKPVDFALLAAPIGRAGKVGEVVGEAADAAKSTAATLLARRAITKGVEETGTQAGKGLIRRGAAKAGEAVAERSPTARRVGETVSKGWRSKPVKIARTGTRVTTAPVRLPLRYSSKHPYQSFGASTGAVGAVAATQSGNPADLLLGPARIAATTAKTTFQHPGDVAQTTLRVVPSLATTVAQLPGDLVAAAIHGNTAPLTGLAQSQIEYFKQIQAVAQDKPYSYTDPTTHQKVTLSPEQLIQHNLGLIPVLSGTILGRKVLADRGITPHAGLDAIGLSRDARIQKLAETMQHGETRAKRIKAEQKLATMKAPLRDRLRQGRRESVRSAATGERINAQWEREVKTGDGRLDKQLSDLHRRPLEGEVSYGDIAQFIGREGLVTADQVLARVRDLRATMKEPKRTLDKNAISTRDVLDAIGKHPEVVRDPALKTFLGHWAEFQRARSVERHTERTGVQQTTPDPEDIRAREMHQARAEGVPLPEEVMPHELRGKVGSGKLAQKLETAKPGLEMEKRLRNRVKRIAKTADRYRAQAKAIKDSHPKEAARLEAKAAEREAEAARIAPVIDRQRNAAGLDRKAVKLERAGKLDEAAQARKDAQALRREDLAAQEKTQQEFAGRMEQARAASGKAEPIFFKEADASDRGHLNVLEQYPSGRLPKKERRRIGTLAQQGRIDEAASTLLENAYRERAAMEMRIHARTFLAEVPLQIEGQRLVHTGPAQRRMFQEGKVPPGYRPFPVQEFNRTLQRGSWDEAAGLVDRALERDIRETKFQEGSKFVLVPEASLRQFKKQMEPWNSGLKHIRVAARLQSLGMLALSPAWFGFQLIASPLAALVAHPNPAAWVRAMSRSLELWHKVPPEQRIKFQSYYGGTSADALAAHQIQAGMKPGTMRDMSTAAGVALRSPVARIGHAIWDQVRQGGPLIKANRAYETKIRDLVAMIESDKQIRNAERVLRTDGQIMGLHDVVTRHLGQLKNATTEERLRFYETHPKAEAELTQAVNDTLGDWNSLSHGERAAAALTVFYPFLRFSLRWLFVAMPKNHPLITAALLNLSQRNAQEIQMLLGGAPSFFPDWGNVVIHDGPNGEPQTGINFSRAAPGSNAILEAMGQGGFNLGTLTAPFQPVIKTALTAAAGQDPLTGRPSRFSKGELLAKGILGLSPPLRPLSHRIGGQSDYSKLFAAITGHSGTPGEYLAPNPLVDMSKEREARRLSHLMNIAFGQSGSEATQARHQIDAMFAKYGIQHSSSGASSSGSSSSSGWRSGGSTTSSAGGWR